MKGRNSVVSFERLVWMYAPSGTWQTISGYPKNPYPKKRPEPRPSRLIGRVENDWVSGIAYLVLAGSLLASLIQFLAAVPALS